MPTTTSPILYYFITLLTSVMSFLLLISPGLASKDTGKPVQYRSERGSPYLMRKLTPEEKQTTLDEMNYYRRLQNASNMIMLQWHPEGEEWSQSDANSCNCANRKPCYRTPDPVNISEVVQSWYEDIKLFPFPDISDYCQFSHYCINYIPLVWANYTHVGCAMSWCDDFRARGDVNKGFLFICRVSPISEFQESPPFYKIGEACSQCPEGYTECVDSLCASPKEDSSDGSNTISHPSYTEGITMTMIAAATILALLME